MDGDSRDPAIEPQNFVGGVKVVDIGDLRVARGLSRRPHSACPHRQLVYDSKERRIWCADCEMNVEAFDAFESFVSRYSKANDEMERRAKRLAEAEKFQARSIAAKKLDEEWRSRTMVPACPHCGMGLFPEDFKNGCSSLGRDYARALAEKRKRK